MTGEIAGSGEDLVAELDPPGSEELSAEVLRVLSHARVLIIEDDTLLAMSAELLLSDYVEAVVGIAATADDAVDIARRLKPDIALIDVTLAGRTDGVDAARVIGGELAIPCLFVTARVDPKSRGRMVSVPHYAGVLFKPYQPRQLIETVATALGAKS
jgi:CheY-like chemotaxis protein